MPNNPFQKATKMDFYSALLYATVATLAPVTVILLLLIAAAKR